MQETCFCCLLSKYSVYKLLIIHIYRKNEYVCINIIKTRIKYEDFN